MKRKNVLNIALNLHELDIEAISFVEWAVCKNGIKR